MDYYENEGVFNCNIKGKKYNIYVNKDEINMFLTKDILYNLSLNKFDPLFNKIYGNLIY